jgi:hypothetical protein
MREEPPKKRSSREKRLKEFMFLDHLVFCVRLSCLWSRVNRDFSPKKDGLQLKKLATVP